MLGMRHCTRPLQHRADQIRELRHGDCGRSRALVVMHHWLMGQRNQALPGSYVCALQATLGVFAWTEKEKPEKLACRAAQAETAAKAKLLARVRALTQPHCRD